MSRGSGTEQPRERKPPARVTLQDVAARAGVSRTTASFVTSGRRDMRISADAEERVMKAARELGYRPSLLARGLRTNLSQTIGLVSDVVATEPYAGDLIRGALATAVRHERLMLVGESEGDPKLEEQLIHSMLDRGVDGFIYAAMSTRETRVPQILRSHPLVLLNCVPRGRPVAAAVIPDERAAGATAATALLDAGHRDDIVLVGESPSHVIAAVERVRGVREALERAGTRLSAQLEPLWWPDDGYAAIHAFLAAGGRPSALLCLNDRLALGAYQALADAGLSVPGDVSVVSFDDSELAAWLRPPLTSVALPYLELGRRAVELLLAGKPPGTVELVDMPLHERASVAAPASAGHQGQGPPRGRR